MPKKVLVAMPAPMLEDIDRVAFAEHRTRSDLIREALRRYLESFKVKHVPMPSLDKNVNGIYV